MSNIKEGEVAYLKTTQEPCFVVRVDGDSPLVLVRRPVGGENTGVRHELNLFFANELESREELQNRQKSSILQFISGPGEAPDADMEASNGKLVN